MQWILLILTYPFCHLSIGSKHQCSSVAPSLWLELRLLHYPYRLIFVTYLSVLLLACSGAESVSIDVDISGTVRYQDKEYSRLGFTGVNNYKYVRFAVIELLDGLVVIDSTTTDMLGRYNLTGTGASLKLRVVAESLADVDVLLSVRNFSNSVYAATQIISDEGVYTLNVDISEDSQIAGAFNILDVYINSSQLLVSLKANNIPELKTFWQPKSSAYGTYYCSRRTNRTACPGGAGIYLLGGNNNGGDTDEFDDDVLMHEYGHFVEAYLGVQDSPGGSHFLTDNDSDLRLAWSEGWGGFFPSAVKSWLQVTNSDLLSTEKSLSSSYFIDTYGSVAGISIDMDVPGTFFCYKGDECFMSSTSEVAVANVLNGFRKKFSMQEVWDAYSLYAPSQTAYASSLEVMWDGWVTQHSPSDQAYTKLYSVLNDRRIFYQLDQYESDDSVGSDNYLVACNSSFCIGQTHYLYNTNGLSNVKDVDNIKFSVQAGKTYQIETYDLSNAADTNLKITDTLGMPMYALNGSLLENDDRPGTVYCYPLENPCKVHNDDKMLSSLIRFTPLLSGTYIAQVTTTINPQSGAGRYGTYSIRIVEQ